MSIKALADVWALSPAAGDDLTPTEKLVLLCYANHANEQRENLAWPSVKTVAEECCLCGPKYARKIIHGLRAKGYLKVAYPARRYTPTMYQVMTSGLPQSRSAEDSHAVGVLPQSGLPPSTPQGSHSVPLRTPTTYPSGLPLGGSRSCIDPLVDPLGNRAPSALSLSPQQETAEKNDDGNGNEEAKRKAELLVRETVAGLEKFDFEEGRRRLEEVRRRVAEIAQAHAIGGTT
jgi:hypothetical protein